MGKHQAPRTGRGRRAALALGLVALLVGVPGLVFAATDTYTPPCTSNTYTCWHQRQVALESSFQGALNSLNARLGDPSPTVTVTETVTPSDTPTPSVSPSPSVTATIPTGFPDASTTGVPAGTTLRTVRTGDSGPCWNVANGAFYVTCTTTIDAFNIPFVLKVMANDVTVTRSKVTAASYYTVNTCDCPTHYSGLSLIDDEIDGGSVASSQSIAVMATVDATYLRVNFHGFASSGPRLASGDLLQDSYIHDFVCQQPDHSAGTTANDGGSHIRIVHNTVDINTSAAGCASTAIGIDQDFGRYDDVLITQNFVNGGAYCMYVAQSVPGNSYGQSTNIHADANVFGRKYFPRCGVYGPIAEAASGNGNTTTGNVWEDGTPLGA